MLVEAAHKTLEHVVTAAVEHRSLVALHHSVLLLEHALLGLPGGWRSLALICTWQGSASVLDETLWGSPRHQPLHMRAVHHGMGRKRGLHGTDLDAAAQSSEWARHMCCH